MVLMSFHLDAWVMGMLYVYVVCVCTQPITFRHNAVFIHVQCSLCMSYSFSSSPFQNTSFSSNWIKYMNKPARKHEPAHCLILFTTSPPMINFGEYIVRSHICNSLDSRILRTNKTSFWSIPFFLYPFFCLWVFSIYAFFLLMWIQLNLFVKY